MRQSLSLNDIGTLTYSIFTEIPNLVKKTVSLNSMDLISNNVFITNPPISYGNLINDKEYSSKKLRQFIIKRYYKSIL